MFYPSTISFTTSECDLYLAFKHITPKDAVVDHNQAHVKLFLKANQVHLNKVKRF